MDGLTETNIPVKGKLVRTVHVAYHMGLLDPSQIDVALEPEPGDSLTLLTLIDQADSEMHVYVLNEEYRRKLVQALTGGVVLPGTPDLNGG